MIKGQIHSIQSLGTLDGPGVRFVVFMQGCNLRCGCCHNPDTWEFSGGTVYTPEEILAKAVRFKEYFGKQGGITLSGGEPLLQSEFAFELFKLCHSEGINTCLDTSGSIFNPSVEKLLSETDRVLLDIKYTDDELYRKYVGCDLKRVLEFFDYLTKKNIPVILRQVIIPTLNDNKENIFTLKKIANLHPNTEKIELLPFKKICITKYDSLGIEFPFRDIPTPITDQIEKLNSYLN